MPLKDKVSHIYEGIMNPSFLNIEQPNEEFANCLDCHHCEHKKAPRAVTKCCDYHPLLPNYVVGAILTDPRTELKNGKNRIEIKIKEKYGITPYGIMPTKAHQNLFIKTRKHHDWPIKVDIDDLLCPYNDQGLCTIWDYRSELCASFHCHSNGGLEGKKFWDILYKYLMSVEMSLSHYVMYQLGYPVNKFVMQRASPDSIKLDNENGILNERLYDHIWDRWKGDEINFYKSCFQVFKSLDKNKYLELIGLQGRILEEKLQQQNKLFIDAVIPKYLVFNKDTIKEHRAEDGQIKLNGININFVHYQLMKLFNGSTSTYEIVRKSMIMHKPMSNLINPWIKAGILSQVNN